jgi:hypothetical protein
MAASDYPGARLVRLIHPEMAPGDSCPESGCEGHLHQLEQPNVKIYLTGQPLISATKYERPALRCSDCFKRYVADLPKGVKENDRATPLRPSEGDPEFWTAWLGFSAKPRSVFGV